MKTVTQNILILVLALSLLASVFFYFDGNASWVTYLTTFLAIGLTYNLFGQLINIVLDKYFPWETTPNRINITIVVYLIGMFLVSIVLSYGETALFNRISFSEFIHSQWGFYKILGYYSISLVFTFFYLSKGLYQSWVESKQKEHELIEAKNKVEIQTLKNQLDPHFLFNNLSVLHSLIEENPTQAQTFVEHISQNYREVLEAQKKEFSTVEEEIQIGINYFNLLKIRMGNSIELVLKENLPMDKKLLPLSVQMGIENALKHNSATEEKPLIIKLYSQDSFLLIENNLQPKNTYNSSKTGIKNLRQRYEFYHTDLQVDVSENAFQLKIPYLS